MAELVLPGSPAVGEQIFSVAPLAVWAIAGWELTWLLLGVAVLTGAPARSRAAA